MVKIGMRKPNLKSSLKARTTGRAKRAMKRALIPGYGKKGMGWVKNPRKAAYNAVYRRTTVGVGDVARVIAPKRRRRGSGTVVVIGGGPDETPTVAPRRTLAGQIHSVRQADTALLLCVLLGWAGVHRAYVGMWGSFLAYLLSCGLLFFGWVRDIVVIARRRSELVRETLRFAAEGDANEGDDEGDAGDAVDGDDGGEEGDDWALRAREEAERRREMQARNREFLESNGVDVGMFTAEKVVADALRAIGEACPCMLRFDHGMADDEPTICFSSPTRTGRLPKNVVEARVGHDVVETEVDELGCEWPRYGDSVGARISYLADGSINKLDVHGRHERGAVNASVRRRGDGLVLTSVGTVDPETGMWQSLCPDAEPTPTEMLEALDGEVERIYR